MPLSWIGLVAWTALLVGFLALLFAGSVPLRRWLSGALRAAVLLGASVSIVLVGIQAFVLRAFCPLCLGSAICFFLLAALLRLPGASASVETIPQFDSAALPALALATLGTAAVLVTLLVFVPNPGDDSGSRASKVLATLNGGRSITEEDLPLSLRLAIYPLEAEAARQRREWLDTRLDELVLAEETKRRGRTPAQLLEELDATVSATSAADLGAWRSAHPEESGTLPDEEVAARLRLAARSAAEDRFLAGLRATSHGVRLRVPTPIPPLVPFDLRAAADQLDGPAEAPVVFVVFSDFQCPFCRQLGANLRAVRRTLGERVAILFKHLPLENVHKEARAYALAAIAAGEQGRFWDYHDALVKEEIGADDAALTELARSLGLDVIRFAEARASQQAAARLAKDVQEADRLGLTQTPMLFLNGRLLAGGLRSTDELVELGRGELKNETQSNR